MTLHMTLAGNLPENNGLEAMRAELLENKGLPRVVVGLVNVKGWRGDTDSSDEVPTIRVLTIEPINDPVDKAAAEQLMREAYKRRTGENALPFDEAGELAGDEREDDDDDEPFDEPDDDDGENDFQPAGVATPAFGAG